MILILLQYVDVGKLTFEDTVYNSIRQGMWCYLYCSTLSYVAGEFSF